MRVSYFPVEFRGLLTRKTNRLDEEQLTDIIMSKARGVSGDRESYPSFWQDLGKSVQSTSELELTYSYPNTRPTASVRSQADSENVRSKSAKRSLDSERGCGSQEVSHLHRRNADGIGHTKYILACGPRLQPSSIGQNKIVEIDGVRRLPIARSEILVSPSFLS